MIRVRILRPAPVDVLIFDSLGLSFLKNTLPVGMDYITLDLRTKLPIVLSLKFCVGWLKLLTKSRFGLRQSYIVALIDEYKPKVVLSFADSNTVLGKYQDCRPNVLVLSVQNALRYPDEVRDIKLVPNYFCLGESTRNLFVKEGVPSKSIVAMGSLALGIFLSDQTIVKERNKYSLVFVSSYRVSFEEKLPNGLHNRGVSEAHKLVFLHLLRYAEEKGIELCVIAKGKVRLEGEHFDREKNYFENLAQGRQFQFSSTVKDTYKSYQIAYGAKLLVTVDSTLGYEALSMGKKVLFGWGVNSVLGALLNNQSSGSKCLVHFLPSRRTHAPPVVEDALDGID